MSARHGTPPAEPAVDHPSALTWGLRCRLRAKHARLLLHEVRVHGAEQRLWWLLPVALLLVLLALAVTTTTSALPVAVYTLF